MWAIRSASQQNTSGSWLSGWVSLLSELIVSQNRIPDKIWSRLSGEFDFESWDFKKVIRWFNSVSGRLEHFNWSLYFPEVELVVLLLLLLLLLLSSEIISWTIWLHLPNVMGRKVESALVELSWLEGDNWIPEPWDKI